MSQSATPVSDTTLASVNSFFFNLACHAKQKLRLPIHSTSAPNSAFGFVKWMVRSLSRGPYLDDSVNDDSRN